MPTGPVFEAYRDRGDEWRWRLVVPNGNIIADSGEGYTSKQGAERGRASVRRIVPEASVRVTDDR